MSKCRVRLGNPEPRRLLQVYRLLDRQNRSNPGEERLDDPRKKDIITYALEGMIKTDPMASFMCKHLKYNYGY